MNYTKISIIALGETGSGKSLFCKLFSKSETFFSKKATESVTTEINSITFKNEEKKVEIFLIDTPGSNDSRGPEQEKKNLILTQKFISEQPRINCIILVMNIQNPRFTDSIKTAIKNICQCFPLPDFWTHVIIFWTHCKFEDEEDEKEQIENIETEVKQSFVVLSEEIEKELHINKIKENQTLNMIYNEYNENSKNEKIKKKNYEKTQKNFEKITKKKMYYKNQKKEE
jgi:GTPase SAR1 family protein